MAELPVTITKFVDDPAPGRVACEFTDADGQSHSFLAKAASVSRAVLTAASNYPQAGLVSCHIEEEWGDQTGLDLARVSLDLADDVGAGGASYVILASDLR